MEPITGPRDLLRMLRRRIVLFLVTAGVSGIAMLLASQGLPLRYTGTTEFERRVDAAAEEVMKSKSQSFAAWKLTLEKELTSEARIVDVLVKLKRLEPRDAAVPLSREESMARQKLLSRVRENLRIDWRVGNEQVDRLALSYTDSDPELAWQVPQGLVEEYGTYVSRQIRDHLTESCNYYTDRIRDANETLKRVRADRVAFQAANSDKYPEPGAYSQRVNTLLAEAQSLGPALELANQREAQLLLLMDPPADGVQPTSMPSREVVGPNPEYARLTEELRRTKQSCSDAITFSGWTEKHPTMLALRKKIVELETSLEQTPRTNTFHQMMETPASGLLQLEFDLAATRSLIVQTTQRLERVQRELDGLQKNVAMYTRVAQEYSDKVKEENDWSEKIKYFQGRHNDLQLQLNAEMSQRGTRQDTLRYAVKPYTPSSPKLWMIVSGTGLGSLALAAVAVFLASFFDRTVTHPELAAVQFDVPVHGVIGEILTASERRKRRARRLLVTPLVALLLVAGLLASAWLAATRVMDNDAYRRFWGNPSGVVKDAFYGDRATPVAQGE
ncbi:MAG: hypothetical protein FWE88_01845 [Phycisphaerae bacterium]|nr:hypothetical protein [Phycisphaerae bacterium]